MLLAIFLLIVQYIFTGTSVSCDNRMCGPKMLKSGGGKISSEVLEIARMTTPEIVLKYGYPVETHQTTTIDGYILSMHRIIREGAQPFFLQHGLFDSSATFIIMGPKISLGYLLWDLGFDVWMGNARGNRYSRKHISLDPEQKDFWQFSWHEIGLYDLPAMIDFVLNITDRKKLFYAGHSQGATSFWVMCSRKPEYNQKIILMQGLGPAAFMSHVKTPIYKIAKDFGETLIRIIGKYEMLPHGKLSALCFGESNVRNAAVEGLFLFIGKNEKGFNKTMWPALCSHLPAGSATNQVLHYYQLIRSGRFCEFDFGSRKNIVKYGSKIPPSYNLSKVTAPVALYYSTNDWLTADIDVEFLYTQLGNPIEKYLVLMPEFNHLDFVWGLDVRSLVYKRFLEVLENFNAFEGKETKFHHKTP